MEISNSLKKYLVSIFTASTFIFSAQTFAGAFQLWEESASSLGDYHAGAAAEANNASTIFYNPAGMSRIKHQQISFGAAFIDLKLNYTGTVAIGGVPYTPSSNNVSGGTFNIVPNFHYVFPINNRLAFGLEETTPFGLSTKYPEAISNVDNTGYLATTTELRTINLNPSISYIINHYLSIGAGVDALYGEALYDDDTFFAPLTNKLTGWGYGYNAGILWQFTQTTRLGLSYRSAITIDATGPSESGSANTTVNADFPLPATTMLSLYHDVNDRLALMASTFYTQWSCFHELVINNIATALGPGTIAVYENYRNTWNFSVGSRYKFNRFIVLEMGFGHDQTPTQLGYRDIRLPDADHYVMSVGLNLHPKRTVEVSMGWTHLFIGKIPVDNSSSLDTNRTSSNLQGFYATGVGNVEGSVNVFGVQLTWDI